MALIDLGVNFSDAQAEAEKALSAAPEGVYEVQVMGYKEGETKMGHKRLMWSLHIINAADPDLNGKNINHFTNLPDNGDLTGVGFLTQFLSAMGTPWEGTTFDPDAVVGRTAMANVTKTDDGKWNNVESFV